MASDCQYVVDNQRSRVPPRAARSYLFIVLENFVRLSLGLDVGALDLPHALDIPWKFACQTSVDWGIIYGDEVLDELWPL